MRPGCRVLESITGLALLGGGVVAAAVPEPAPADEHTLQAARLATDGPALLEFFRKRTLSDADRDRVQALVRLLGAEDFHVRERASAELVALGSLAVPVLQRADQDPDIEVVRRAQRCLQLIEGGLGPAVPAAAARLLARRRPAGAVEVLLAYLPFTDDESVADAVCRALAALAVTDGRPDPALVRALADALPQRRALAAVALCQAGASQLAAVRPLLRDPEPAVRLRVGLALAERKDRDAVATLIALLGELPPAQLGPAEDFLDRLAGEQAPTLALGGDGAARRKYRDAWAAWWRQHGPTVDFGRLDAPPRLLGYTLLVQMDVNFNSGQVVELGRDGKPRWKIDGLQYPIDAQVLPGDRVLIAEFNGRRVTERDLKGKVLWQKNVNFPVAARRLPNGNTFIALRHQLLEVDRNGREVFSLERSSYDIMTAQRLRNGQIAFATSSGLYVRLDAGGRELNSAPVLPVQTFGGMDVQPGGRAVLPAYGYNKVVEYDPAGKLLWEVDVQLPSSAVRLPGGTTLIASQGSQRVVEVDATGKVVWEHKSDGRPIVARRR